MSKLTTEQLAERLVDAEMAKREAEAYAKELKDALLERIGRGQVVSVESPPVLVDGVEVRPMTSVEIRHKSSSKLKYREDQVIRLLEDLKLAPAYVTLETREFKELDRRSFEQDLYEMPGLGPVRRFVQQSESDWIEIRGLP